MQRVICLITWCCKIRVDKYGHKIKEHRRQRLIENVKIKLKVYMFTILRYHETSMKNSI